MPKYNVYVKVTDYFLIEIEAEDEYEAAEMAEAEEKWFDAQAYDSDVDAWLTELA